VSRTQQLQEFAQLRALSVVVCQRLAALRHGCSSSRAALPAVELECYLKVLSQSTPKA